MMNYYALPPLGYISDVRMQSFGISLTHSLGKEKIDGTR